MEIYYKIAIGILFICWGCIRLAYKKPYERTKNEILFRKYIKREKRLVACIWFCTVMPYTLYWFTSWLEWGYIPIPNVLRVIALLMACIAIGLVWLSHKALGIYWSPVLEIKGKHQLISTGIYQKIRHPMYAAVFLLYAFAGIASANVITFFIPVITFTILCYIRIADEEKMMISWFGDDYRIYRRKTGMFFPKRKV